MAKPRILLQSDRPMFGTTDLWRLVISLLRLAISRELVGRPVMGGFAPPRPLAVVGRVMIRVRLFDCKDRGNATLSSPSRRDSQAPFEGCISMNRLQKLTTRWVLGFVLIAMGSPPALAGEWVSLFDGT